jgi:cation diffusion facilitator CzcD-associated flavoprotein CzcO
MAAWRRNTRRVGMVRLRSGVMHDIDPRPLGLHHFIEARLGGSGHAVASRERHPTLEAFDAHADTVLERMGIASLCEQGTVTGLVREAGRWRVTGLERSLVARRVILAIGRGRPRWPSWARSLAEAGATIGHVFEPAPASREIGPTERLVIVGGGLSATQLAVASAAGRPGRVTLLRRRAPVISPFDADPVWTGGRRLPGLCGLPMAERRRIVDGARRLGSITPAAARALHRVEELDALDVRQAEVVEACRGPGGAIELRCCDGHVITAGAVVLATGFEPVHRLPWIDALADALGLARAPCGGAVLGAELQWAPNLAVTGELAELSLGPLASNIAGARLAAVRLSRCR